MRWHPHLEASTPYHPWLTTPGSLTARLRQHCPQFNVERLRQGHARPFNDEGAVIGLPRPAYALVREVVLRCGERPLVFAHSITPLDALDGAWREIVGLGNRPLGDALFSNPRIQRQALAFARIDARHPLYRAAAKHLEIAPQTVWARRSLFLLHNAPLLVSEVFLPGLIAP
jgi:chorismate lyase